MTTLDCSLTLTAPAAGTYQAVADPAYEANTGMFGGWTAALLLKAVLSHPAAEGTAAALTVNFIQRVPPGSTLGVRVQRLGGSRSLMHWRSDLMLEENGELAASATIVLAHRRPTDRFVDGSMPKAPEPEAVLIVYPPGPFGQRTENRISWVCHRSIGRTCARSAGCGRHRAGPWTTSS